MTRDDIIRMARDAGIPETEIEGVFRANSDDLGRLLAAEREAIANLVEQMGIENYGTLEIAVAIRARGQS
jgi:hypothetical protein